MYIFLVDKKKEKENPFFSSSFLMKKIETVTSLITIKVTNLEIKHGYTYTIQDIALTNMLIVNLYNTGNLA
jgi:hypothetical protein